MQPSLRKRSATSPADRLPVTWPTRVRPDCASPRAARGRLEEFDRVARRILEQDLRAAGARHGIVPKPHAGGAEPCDLRGEISDDEMDAIPAARSRPPAVGHEAPGGTGGPAQQQPQVAERDLGERRRRAGKHCETEVFRFFFKQKTAYEI